MKAHLEIKHVRRYQRAVEQVTGVDCPPARRSGIKHNGHYRTLACPGDFY